LTTKQERDALLGQDLHKLLSDRLPQFRTKQRVFDVPGFAAAIGMSAEGAYKWLRADKVSPEGARKIIELTKDAETPVTPLDLLPYVF
jgi:hypothetical protein